MEILKDMKDTLAICLIPWVLNEQKTTTLKTSIFSAVKTVSIGVRAKKIWGGAEVSLPDSQQRRSVVVESGGILPRENFEM